MYSKKQNIQKVPYLHGLLWDVRLLGILLLCLQQRHVGLVQVTLRARLRVGHSARTGDSVIKDLNLLNNLPSFRNIACSNLDMWAAIYLFYITRYSDELLHWLINCIVRLGHEPILYLEPNNCWMILILSLSLIRKAWVKQFAQELHEPPHCVLPQYSNWNNFLIKGSMFLFRGKSLKVSINHI